MTFILKSGVIKARSNCESSEAKLPHEKFNSAIYSFPPVSRARAAGADLCPKRLCAVAAGIECVFFLSLAHRFKQTLSGLPVISCQVLPNVARKVSRGQRALLQPHHACLAAIFVTRQFCQVASPKQV